MKLILKSIMYAALLMLLAGVALAVLAWTKGLFILVLIFVVLAYYIHNVLKFRPATMRKEDRKWL